jgi:2-keto-4-pentenoate hydratase/2-oxohepta-3-ene-1,7-dioic acid hydratase in catechol pathway
MRIARYQDASGEHWGAIDFDSDVVRPFVGPVAEWAPALTADPAAAVEVGDGVALARVELLPPLLPTSEITGLMFNYADGVVPPEGADAPMYQKPMSSMVGQNGVIRYPDLIPAQPQCTFVYEINLVAVMGRDISDPRHGTKDVLGYTIGNDGTLRNERPSFVAMDLFGAKSAYQSSSLGPWIVTKDELGGDGQPDLELTTRVNGTITQRSRTKNMRLPLDDVIEEINSRSRLDTGDVIFTGTCGYVGVPDGHCLPGADLEFEIEGIGTLRNTVEETDPFPMHVAGRWDGHSIPGTYPVGDSGTRS